MTFSAATAPGETFDERVRTPTPKKFIGRGEPGASETWGDLSIEITPWSTSWCSSAHQKGRQETCTAPQS